MRLYSKITVFAPSKLVFGSGSYNSFIDDLIQEGKDRVFILADLGVVDQLKSGIIKLEESGVSIKLDSSIQSEPSFDDYEKLLYEVNHFKPPLIVGIGGGSVLDTAKLLAATSGTSVNVRDFLAGKKKLKRNIEMICLPTTAGTGSEVSPNAIFFDPESNGKVGVIDPQLVPDATYVDPLLTKSVPPAVTASTGLDALTHCIEAYANKFANPYNDLLALEGIRLIGQNLKKAFDNGEDEEAREKIALGSMYGGMCLGPVNTAAVHALAYPIGSSFKIAHGVSNAMLLPFVLEYNLHAAEEKYANIARAIGASDGINNKEIALEGVRIIREMISYFKIPGKLSDLNINEHDIETMASSAMNIQRLLKNNVRPINRKDAIDIYTKAL